MSLNILGQVRHAVTCGNTICFEVIEERRDEEEVMWASVIQFCWSFFLEHVPPTLILQEITIPKHFRGRRAANIYKTTHGRSLTEGKQTAPSVGSVFLTSNSKCDWNTLNFKTNHNADCKQAWSVFWHARFLWYVLLSTAPSMLDHSACLHPVLTGIPLPFRFY